MFVSKSEIESLVVDLALKQVFEREGAHEFLYHLSMPGKNIPRYIAEVLIEHPEVTIAESELPARLAFGIVDDALCRFDLEMRKKRQLKLFRALNLVRLSLQQHDFPDTAIQRSNRYYRYLLYSATALERLAEEEHIFPAEASTLVEQVLQAHLEVEAVTELLCEIQIRRLTSSLRSRLRNRMEEALESGTENQAVQSGAIMVLDEPLGFREEIKSHQHFHQSSQQLKSLLETFC